MGCCVSIPNPTNRHEISSLKHPLHSISKSLPPTSDEEFVKEVLITPHHYNHTDAGGLNHDNPSKLNPARNIQNFDKPTRQFNSPSAAPSSEDISDLSEVYSSVSETFEQREAAACTPVAQRLSRSPAGGSRRNGSFSGELGRFKSKDIGSSLIAGRSPARRSGNPSPRRRNEGGGGGVIGRQKPGQGPVRRGLGLADGQMKWDSDGISNSSRRSRSPATRVEVTGGGSGGGGGGGGRTGNMGRNGPSPGRIRMVQQQPENDVRRSEENGFAGRWPTTHPNESLENPLVSLECFIFL